MNLIDLCRMRERAKRCGAHPKLLQRVQANIDKEAAEFSALFRTAADRGDKFARTVMDHVHTGKPVEWES